MVKRFFFVVIIIEHSNRSRICCAICACKAYEFLNCFPLQATPCSAYEVYKIETVSMERTIVFGLNILVFRCVIGRRLSLSVACVFCFYFFLCQPVRQLFNKRSITRLDVAVNHYTEYARRTFKYSTTSCECEQMIFILCGATTAHSQPNVMCNMIDCRRRHRREDGLKFNVDVRDCSCVL